MTSRSSSVPWPLFLGGLPGLQWQNVRHLAPERLAVIVAVAVASATVGPRIPAAVLLAGVAILVAAMQVISVRRFDRLEAPA